MAIDRRFLADLGPEIFTGNELLVKGALETEGGVHLMTGYPGSPVAGFFDCLGDIADLLIKNGVRAFQANNEALAVAAVNGSQMLPCRTIVAFKSVGAHVASDALALGNLAGTHPEGGAVVISGEDPWCESTQVPTDSRFIFQHLRMPVVEPGGPQELKDWVGLCFKLSNVAGLYIGYLVTVAHADGGGTVSCRPNNFPAINTNQRVELDTSAIPLEKMVLLPPRTWRRELGMEERHEATVKAARELGINRIIPATDDKVTRWQGDKVKDPITMSPPHLVTPSSAPLGFIVTGMGGPYLRHVLSDLGLAGEFPVLQMGMSYPVDTALVREFSGMCRTMVVIEERRSFLEMNIRDALFRELPQDQAAEVCARVYGKCFPPAVDGSKIEGIPATRGLNVSVLTRLLVPLIRSVFVTTENTESTEKKSEVRGQRSESESAVHPSNPLCDLRDLRGSITARLTEELQIIREASKPRLTVSSIVPRTPTFCPGCPHRDSSAVLLEVLQNFKDPQYMRKHHGIGPVDLVAHGDTGCYTMLMFAPTEQLMHNYSGMGLGGGTGSGIDPFITNKQIVFMGDGTFFHSGQIAISNAIKAGQDITFIILENKTTAMTGHQEHAGTETDLLGNRSYIQDIDAIVRAMAGTSPLTVAKLSPAQRSQYKAILEKTILAGGVKVIIADKECGITRHRTEMKEERKTITKFGYLPRKTHMNITAEVCENCLECTKQTACPGLTTVDTDYGRKIDTDLTWCVNDGACERVRVSNEAGISVKPCPSFEEVTIIRRKRRRYRLPNMGLAGLPEAQIVHDWSKQDAWRVHMAGVGGMGIGVVSAILVRAGHKDGLRVVFQEKKGLAIRNGGVFSQITFVKERSTGVSPVSLTSRERERAEDGTQTAPLRSRLVQNSPSADHGQDARATQDHGRDAHATTGNIPYGKADLLLGIDILEAARATDPKEGFRVASKSRTAAVLNLYKQPTVYALLGRQDFDPEALRQEVLERCREDLSFAINLSELCEQRLGSKQYANIMILGMAYQLGLIPVSVHAIAWAIRDTIRRDQRKNMKAFNIGRKLALEPRALPRRPLPLTWEQLLVNKAKVLRKTRMFGHKWATRFEQLVQSAMVQMPQLPAQAKYDLAVRIYDLLQYQDHALAGRYVEQVHAVYAKDSAGRAYAATVAAIWNIAKVTLIKDEPYVAYLLTRYEKVQRDIAKFGADLANGDKLVYRHLTSPEFNIGPWRIRLKIRTRPWQLRLVRHMTWWRKLPGWHRRETAFRDWYISLVDRINLATDDGYEQALRWLKSPEGIAGYREIRYPKMDQVRAEIEREPGKGSRSAADSGKLLMTAPAS